MRSNRSNGFDGDPEWNAGPISGLDREFEPDYRNSDEWNSAFSNSNSADEVFGELGLILVVVLGVVLAINMMLVAFHIS